MVERGDRIELEASKLYPISGVFVNLFMGFRGYIRGFGPGLRSRVTYSRAACSVVTQFRPIFIPQRFPRRTSRLK